MKKYEIKLTIDELKLIDGKVSEEAQKVINEAHKENSYGFDLPIINEILKKAEEMGSLTWRNKQINHCSYCDDKPYDYYRYSRGGRYHNKGDKNYDKPKYYSGIKFHEGFITVEGSGDMCKECCEQYKVIEQLIDYILDNDLKIEIQKNEYKDSRYLKDEIKICFNCNEEMPVSKMGVNHFNNRPSVCPHCKESDSAFGRSHKNTEKFIHRFNPLALEEMQSLKKELGAYDKSVDSNDDKIAMYRNDNNENVFVVREKVFNNGHRTVIKVNTEKKVYYMGYSWEEKGERFANVLNGYEKTDSEYGDFE